MEHNSVHIQQAELHSCIAAAQNMEVYRHIRIFVYKVRSNTRRGWTEGKKEEFEWVGGRLKEREREGQRREQPLHRGRRQLWCHLIALSIVQTAGAYVRTSHHACEQGREQNWCEWTPSTSQWYSGMIVENNGMTRMASPNRSTKLESPYLRASTATAAPLAQKIWELYAI